MLPKVREAWRLSERRACVVLDINRKMLHYCPVKRDDPILRARIKEIAHTRIRYGYERITILLRREGWQVNRKRVRRIYREENLAIRAKTPKRRRAAVVRTERVVPSAPNQSWAMDFMHDVLADGTKIRLLTIVDSFSRESLALEVALGFKSTDVVEVLRRLIAERGSPQRIHCDNGPEFVSLQLDQWAYWNRVKLDFSRPGRRQITLFANRSTTACDRNCSTRIGSDRLQMPARRPQRGAAITTPITRTARWEISHRKSTPAERRTSLNSPSFLERSRSKNGETSTIMRKVWFRWPSFRGARLVALRQPRVRLDLDIRPQRYP